MAKKKAKKKLTKAQERTIKKMQLLRHIDSENLRALIEQKEKWVIAEIKKGVDLIKRTQVGVTKLEGVRLFIKDLKDPIKEEEK